MSTGPYRKTCKNPDSENLPPIPRDLEGCVKQKINRPDAFLVFYPLIVDAHLLPSPLQIFHLCLYPKPLKPTVILGCSTLY